jgi:hypothetical protein
MEGSALTPKNREGTRRCTQGSFRRREGRGHDSWPKIPSGRCWECSIEPAEPSSKREEPARQWRHVPHRSVQSGTRCRGDCFRKREPAEPRNCLLAVHALTSAIRRASGASLFPADVPVGVPAGRKPKRAEMGRARYIARQVIVP